jgi:hypothetical protein
MRTCKLIDASLLKVCYDSLGSGLKNLHGYQTTCTIFDEVCFVGQSTSGADERVLARSIYFLVTDAMEF